jgi:SAM-dependent methyltransferase
VSDAWAAWRAEVDLDEYAQRWDRMAASGSQVHGEADLVSSLGRAPVLDGGCGMGRVAIELARRGFDVVGVDLDEDMLAVARRLAPELRWVCGDLATVQLDLRFGIVVLPGNTMVFVRPEDRPAVVANMAAHLRPGGLLVTGFTPVPGELDATTYDEVCAACDLALVDRWATWDRLPYVEGGYQVCVHVTP